MVEHPKCSGCFTDLVLVDSKGHVIKELRRVPRNIKFVETELLLQGNVIHTSTFMFRSDVLSKRTLEFIAPMPYGDMALFLAASTFGPIGYLPGVTSAYRTNVGVLTSVGKSQRIKNSIFIRESFVKEYDQNGRLAAFFNRGKKHYLLRLAIGLFVEGKLFEGIGIYISFWWHSIYRLVPSRKLLHRIGFVDHFKPLWYLLKAVLS